MAVERARAATADMAELARVGVVQAMSLTHKWDDSLAQKVREEEEKVDKYEDALGTYLVKLSSREMSHADSQSVNTLLHTISDFERISDCLLYTSSVSSAPCSCKKRIARVVWALARAVLPRFAVSQLV